MSAPDPELVTLRVEGRRPSSISPRNASSKGTRRGALGRALLALAALVAAACGGPTGWRNVWSEDGSLDVEHTGFYAGGRKVSEGYRSRKEQLWPNGRRAVAGLTRNGLQHGLWIYWYENGETAAQGMWVAGLREGWWTEWHENGQKASEGRYLHGHRVGTWTFYDEHGRLVPDRSGEYLGTRR